MEALLQFVATPFVIILMSKVNSKIYIKDTLSAFLVGLAILITGFLIGWVITLLLNILTLGILWAVGLGVITRTIAYAIVIEIVDVFSKSFNTKGFGPSLLLAVVLAIVWSLISNMVG